MINQIIGSDIVIWTTTPWTIPGNRAIAYGSKLEYNLIEIKKVNEGSLANIGEKLIIARELKDKVLKEIGIIESNVGLN